MARLINELVNKTLRKVLQAPPRNVWPAVPEPYPRLEVLQQTVTALKQGYEQLIRTRGDRRNSALLLGEFDDFAQQIRDTATEWVDPPAHKNSAGEPGQLASKGGFLYVCVAANRWRRVQLLEW
jgi:hypothetical protein